MRLFPIVLVSLSVVACGSSYRDEPPTSDSNVKSAGASGGTSDGKSGGSDPGVGKSDDAGADPTGKGSGDPTGKDGDGGKPTADPTCVTTCATTMVQKCGGDMTICDSVCALTQSEIACLAVAPTCDKSEWLRCQTEADAGAAAGKGGGK